MHSFTRRLMIKLLGIGAGWITSSHRINAQHNDDRSTDSPDRNATLVSWQTTCDRVWLGGQVWANPMEDWRVKDGYAECQSFGGYRNIHLLTHQLTNTDGRFAMKVEIAQQAVQRKDGGAGFKIGIRSDINEHRSNVFARNGIAAGVIGNDLVLHRESVRIPDREESKPIVLRLSGAPQNDLYQLTLTASDTQGTQLASLTASVPRSKILGNVALVNNFDLRTKNNGGARYRFRDWSADGDAFTVNESHRFGPILWTMYSLSDSRGEDGFVMKLSALTGPLGANDNRDVELLVKRNGKWQSLATEELDEDAWTATFRFTHWDEKTATPYKVVYRHAHTDGSESESTWEGVIRANPSGGRLRLGALTCQKDYAFPYQPVVDNLSRLDPDMLYFSGDQLYEDHGGYGLIRDPAGPAILNYLRKYYQHGWAFRSVMKDRPTICIPDDHDVFQGNIWGEGGAPMKRAKQGASSNGGYREPARMVNVVHKTNTAHHPDLFDATPCKQGISVYYGDLVFGDVSFAILGDRQFKSGPEHVDTGRGRADHVEDENFDTTALDQPGLQLLGERQEEFLEQWADDWRGHTMKVLLSQTVFAGVATHHGKYDGYLKADLDCGGWPQTARNRTIRILKKARPLHINGDQHLASLVQYGADQQRDSCWSFCTPAIAVGYPRWWRPDDVGMRHDNRPMHGLDHTGEFRDGLGNHAYVYAVGDPEVPKSDNRYQRAHEKGSGFGLVTINTINKTYRIEAFRFAIDATDGKPSNQFPGWPLTIHQKENAGNNLVS